MKLILNCGKAHDKLEELSLDCEFLGTNADSLQQTKAFAVLQDLMNDPEFGTDGRRNDDAVNMSIAVWVLGYDPLEWFGSLDDVVDFDSDDFRYMNEHLGRIYDYVKAWGPDGNKALALDKLITK